MHDIQHAQALPHLVPMERVYDTPGVLREGDGEWNHEHLTWHAARGDDLYAVLGSGELKSSWVLQVG